MLQSRHFASKLLIGKGLTAFPAHYLVAYAIRRHIILGLRRKTGIFRLKNTDLGYGASINEDKINRGGEKLAGMRLKSHLSEKDGALASLFSETFVASARLKEPQRKTRTPRDGLRGAA